MRRPPPHPRPAFTLIELLVVVAIVGLLVTLMLPAIQAAREASRRTVCSHHLRQTALAMLEYETAVRAFPAGRIGCDDTGDLMDHPVCPPGLPPEKKTAASGFVQVLPYLERQDLYDQLDVDHGGLWNRNVDDLGWYYDSSKYRGIKQRIATLVCPSDISQPISDVYLPVRAATASYAMVQGTLGPDAPLPQAKFQNDGMFLYVTSREASHITDGLSKTMMLGEVLLSDTWESSNTWSYALVHADCLRSTRNPLNTRPGDGVALHRQNGAFGSQHPHGAHFAYADGHIDFEDEQIDLAIYRAKSTVEGKERLLAK